MTALLGVVLAGLDVVAAGQAPALKGRRVGLVVHAASVTADGVHAIDVLRGQGVVLARLFAPEHGLRGEAPAGAVVDDGLDVASGVALTSLYGAKRRPSADDLRGLEALVVDLQDAGVRFYTYASTLLLCLDAAAEAGLDLVVLDRPNPLGGRNVEGPLSQRPHEFLSMAPGPLIHGLTLGELARLANADRPRPARLEIVRMRGWRRSMAWHETGRRWTRPSPNLVSAEAALVYPALALLEATSVSEGRGTPTPFLLLGAPWLDVEALLGSLQIAGIELAAQAFTPVPSAAAPEPKHAGRPCRGLRVRVTDAGEVRPWRAGLQLLRALRAQRGFGWLRDGAALDALLGTADVREALDRGASAASIEALDATAVAAFRRARAPVLLYPE